jgi:hypothetical protein
VTGLGDGEEFTFACPNHPSVQYAVQEHLRSILEEKLYDGLFLDRIRFPALRDDPIANLGCFCEHCRRKAAEEGLDLDETGRELIEGARTARGRIKIVEKFLNDPFSNRPANEPSALERFISFRKNSITRFVQIASEQIRHAGLQVSLDCFAPALAGMVGQDLRALGATADWVKVMTYAHVNAPAGMPYELTDLIDWLLRSGLDERTALAELEKALHYKMPSNRSGLVQNGLSAEALRVEVSRAILETGAPLLAGIELVDLPGVTRLHDEQIRKDLRAVLSCNPAGLALSWDLRHIPLERLKLAADDINHHFPLTSCCQSG